MYPVMSLLMIGVGIVLVFSAKKVSQKNVAGMSGILGTFMIVAGLGALWFLMTGRIALPLG